MADPRIFDAPAAVVYQEAMESLQAMLRNGGSATDARQPLSERYPSVPGSLTSLLEVVSSDHQVREVHGKEVLVAALTRVLEAQQRRIDELEKKLSRPKGRNSSVPKVKEKVDG